MTQSSSYSLHNIQMLRGLAAVMVLMYHLLPQYEAMGGKLTLIHDSLSWGFMGVDIFFIISGFIMAYTTFKKERSIINAKTFIKHRLFRVYLGYWPFFFIMFVTYLIFSPDRLASLDIINSFFLTSQQILELVLPVSWSLGYELYFYFLFLFTFLFSIKQLYLYLPIFISFIFLLVLYSLFQPTFPRSFFYSPYLLEFFAGVLLYMYKDHLMKIWLLPVSLIIIFIALLYGDVNYHAGHDILRIFTLGVAALCIVHIALILEHNNFYRVGKKFEALGNASYALYLSHTIIMLGFYSVGLRGFFTSSESTILPLAGAIFIIILCISFSLIYYKKIERPMYLKAINYRSDL